MTKRALAIFLLALAVFAAAILKALTWPILTGDEAWFLQVLQRMTSGEVLYRDVFFGATPLSIYLVAPLTTLLGVEVLVVRAVAVLCFMLIVIVCDGICRQFRAGDRSRVLLATGLLAFALPAPLPPYASLATLFLLACFWTTLFLTDASRTHAGWERGRLLATALAGAFAGLSFCAKQNVGAYALGALLLALLRLEWGAGRGAWRPAAGALVAFISMSAAFLVPVWLTGGISQFLDYAFLNKATYLRLARVSYGDGLKAATHWLIGHSGPGVATLTFLVPPLALAALLVTWHQGRREGRRETEVVLLYSAAAVAAMFPRACTVHVAYVLPVFFVALAHSWQRLSLRSRPRLMGPLAGILGVFLCGVVAVALVEPMSAALAGTLQVSNLRHFRGVLLTPSSRKTVQAASLDLPAVARDEGVFILGTYAAFSYLVTGTRNPTPYDFPLATAFGRKGEEQVISALSRGRLRFVCLDPRHRNWGPLRPERLMHCVQDAMDPVAEAGLCTLYRLRGSHDSAPGGAESSISPSGFPGACHGPVG